MAVARPAVVKRASNAATMQAVKVSLVNIPITCTLPAQRCVQAIHVHETAALLKNKIKK